MAPLGLKLGLESAGPRPSVGIIMGSDSDLPTMKAAADVLLEFGVPFEITIVSAHRTPSRMYSYASAAADRGIQVGPWIKFSTEFSSSHTFHLPGVRVEDLIASQ